MGRASSSTGKVSEITGCVARILPLAFSLLLLSQKLGCVVFFVVCMKSTITSIAHCYRQLW
ncbi:hypothetical protein AHAS_Ahas12G0098300 [Arachis hypogaea]